MSNQPPPQTNPYDFTTLPRPFGTNQQAKPPASKKEELTTIGFRVKPSEYAVIQEYVNAMHSNIIVHPETGQQVRLLEQPSVGMMVKAAVMSYMLQFNYIMSQNQAMLQQQQQHAQQYHGQPPNGRLNQQQRNVNRR